MQKIDYFFSLLSPFTYLAGARLEEIALKHGAEIVYRPADMPKVFAETGGVPVPKRHPARQAYRLQELRRLSEWAGLPLTLQPAHWPTDARPASYAVIAAAEAGGPAGDLARAFLRAVWAQDRDIADLGVVAEVLAAHALDPMAMSEPMQAAASVFEANTAAALEAGVFGAPFYIVGEERFWGQDRLDFLDRHLAALE